MKHQRNTHHNKTNKDDIEKIKPLHRLQENVFDLDSLQKAARDGDDVLRKYIKELSTKMTDSQTGELSNRPTTDNLDLHVLPSAQNYNYTNSFKLDAKYQRQDSSDSPRGDNNFFQSQRKRSDGWFDLNLSNSNGLESHRSYTSTIAESSDDHMQYSSLKVENRKSKYVPKISRPAIESSQLQKWGFYDDHESDLSMQSEREEEEKVYHTFESDQNDFDLLTHRPNNRPYSPLVYSASYSENMGSESTRNSPSYDEFNLVTHRPATNSSNKLFERVDQWYESKCHFHETINKPSLSSDSNDSIDKFLKIGSENRRSTSPEQHMIGIWKYHQIEKQRRKSHKNSDDINSTVSYEELVATEKKNSGCQDNQQESAFKISNWSSDDEDKKSSMNQEVLTLKRDDELCFEHAPWRYSASPESPKEYLTLKPEIAFNDDDMNDNVEDNKIPDCIYQNQDVRNLQIRNTNEVDTEKPVFDFYDKQFNSLPLSRSPEPSVSHYHQVPKVKNNFENDIPSNDYVCVPSSAEIKDRKPPTLDLACITDDNNQHEPGGELPFIKKIIDSDLDIELQVPAEKKKQSTSPLNSRKKTANRLLGRGQSQKQRWSTSSSLPSSVLATRVSSLLSSSLKDRKTGSLKEASRNKHREGNSAEKLKRSHQKKVINGNFFTVTPANMSTDFNSINLLSHKEFIPPLTLQLLSDSPRGGEGLSIWQLLPDELLFHICTYLSPSSLAIVAQVCQTFHRIANDELLWKTITLQKKELTDDWLIQIGEKHPTDISLLQCNGSKVTEDGLRTMFRTCSKSLKKLNASGSTGGDLIGDSILLHASRCVKLTSLDVSWCSVTNNGLVSIGESIEKLQVLCLNGCQALTDDSINMVLQKHCKSINVLELFGCFNISPAVITQVGKLCRHLRTLNVGQCYKMTDDDMVTMVTHLEHVLNLDMRGCKQMHDTTVRKLVRSCKKLKSISLANCGHLTDASLIEISTYLPTIKMIDVSGCKKITNQGVHSLAKSSYNLSSLDLSSTSVNCKSISSLSSYCGKSLRSLKLNFCKDVTEKSVLKLLQNCHRLEVLQLYGVKGLRNLSSIKSQFPALKFD
ncbi:uncharacterized protein [Antedon mediterranea]|uniref:uncharacterized protein n=1 Tax=Antedon mediterranea TaxID=105859 RepID=UPI003AF566F1